jgi:nucleotide-binding universal stress UspA family protein
MTFQPKRILCAVDLREPSKQIVEWAAALAGKLGGKVEFVHADWWEAPPYFFPGQIASLKEQAKENQEALRSKLAELTAGVEVPHEVNIVEGHPAAVILERAVASGAELIVMGSHGRTGFSRLRLGSVAEDMIHAAPCPVLVVRNAAARERVTVRNVVCPVNFTPLAKKTLEAAANIAAAFQAKLWVVHALESGGRAEVKREELCAWIPENVRGSCQLSEVIREGSAAEQLVLFAKEKRADLIVLGAQHQAFLEFTNIGTTTERVMRHSTSSVLVIPSGR